MASDNNKLEKVIQTGLINPGIDLSIDFTEVAIDSILDGVLKEIPIVKSMVGITKGILAIRDIYNIKKLLIFFQKFHQDSLDQKAYEEFMEKFNEDKNYRNKVVEQIVILNDRFVDTYKSEILANLLAAHVNKKIDWDTFIEISQVLDVINIKGLRTISKVNVLHGKIYQIISSDPEILIDGYLLISAGVAYLVNGRIARLNKIGVCLLKYGIEKNMDFVYEDKY